MERRQTTLPQLGIKHKFGKRKMTYGEQNDRVNSLTKKKNLERFINSQDKRSRMKADFHFSFIGDQGRGGQAASDSKQQQHYYRPDMPYNNPSTTIPLKLNELLIKE